MLVKQSIRSTSKIYIDGVRIEDKERIIALSETWSEKQEIFFRKMLQQGGEFSLKGVNFTIAVVEPLRNSKGEIDVLSKEDENE